MPEDLLSGGREPDGPLGPEGPRTDRPRRWLAVGLVVVVLLAAVGLAVHRYGLAGFSAAPAPQPSSTDAASDVLPGDRPTPFGNRVDLRLLVLGAAPVSYDLSRGSRAALDTGANTDAGSVQAAVSLADGDVLAFSLPGGGDAARPGGGETVLGCRPHRTPVPLGRARTVLDAHDGRTVWLIGSPTAHGTLARRVTLTGQRVGADVRLASGDVVGATNGGDGLVVSVGAGRSQRLQVVQAGMHATVATDSELVAASMSALVVRSYLTGALSLRRPGSPFSRSVPLLLPGAAVGPAALSPDGSTVAAVVRTANGTTSVAVGPSVGGTIERPLSIVPDTRTTSGSVAPQLSAHGSLVLDIGHRRVLIVEPAVSPEHIASLELPEFASTVAY